MSNWSSLKIADGTTMQAFVARSSKPGKKPAIIVIQEAYGANHHMQDVTERFAKLGFVALCPDLYHRIGERIEISYQEPDKAMKTLGQLTDAGQTNDLKAAFEFLKNDPDVDASQIACVGYCMGGRSVFLASTFLPLKAAISYYGGRIPSLLSHVDKITAPLMLIWGGKDKHIGKDQHDEIKNALTKAGKSFIHVEFSEADHAFFCDERKNYHQKSAEISWDMTISFLQKNMNFDLGK